jgi:pyrophosphatase PpaX
MKILALDLDGTILNSMGGSIACIQRATKDVLGKSIEPHEITEQFGQPEERIFLQLFGEPKVAELMTVYLKLIAEAAPRFKPFEGILELLGEARELGYGLGIYTGRGLEATEILLKEHRLSSEISLVITGSQLKNSKPHPEGILELARQMKTDLKDIFYLGDSPMDWVMAQAAGAKGLRALWGQGASHVLESSDLPAFFKPSDLVSFLKKHRRPD